MGSLICKQEQSTIDLSPKNKKNGNKFRKEILNRVESDQISIPKLNLSLATEIRTEDSYSEQQNDAQNPEAKRGLPLNPKEFQQFYYVPKQKEMYRQSAELTPIVSYIAQKIKNKGKYQVLEIKNEQLENESSFKEKMQQYLNFIHPNIIQLEEYFCQNNRYYLVMEFCEGGSLQEFINERKQNNQYFSEREIQSVAYQLLKACSYMHWNGVTHKNINPKSIQLMSNKDKSLQQIKISNYFQVENCLNNSLNNSNSLHFQAPEEVFKKQESNKIDIWSIGVIILYLLTGQKILSDLSTQEDYIQLYNNSFDIKKHAQLEGLSEMLTWMITKMLVIDVNNRIDAMEALKVLSFEMLSNTGNI